MVDEKIGAAEAAQALGLSLRGRRWGPCPACGAESDSNRRGPITTTGPRWACWKCGARGDGVNLISYVLTGEPKRYREAFKWLEDRGTVAPAVDPVFEEPRIPIPTTDLTALLRACTKARDCNDADLVEHCRSRGIDHKAAPGGILPPPGHPVYSRTRDWWPGHRSRTWRIVLPMFDHRGRLKTMHARSTTPGQTPKALWPGTRKGPKYDNAGVFFADGGGRAFLRGEARPTRVLVCEGFSDSFAVMARPPAADAMLGIESGSAERLRLLQWPPGVELYCATHADAAGDLYAAKIIETVTPLGVPVYRIPLMRA